MKKNSMKKNIRIIAAVILFLAVMLDVANFDIDVKYLYAMWGAGLGYMILSWFIKK